MFARLLKSLPLIVLGMGLFGGVALGQDYQIKFKPENPEDILALKWEDLMSQADLDAILNAPPVSHEGYGWEDQLNESSPENDAFQKALQSFDVNPDLLDQRVLLPGFIVPTAYNAERKVTEFFLVPFFGACIHVPPPPPNQIIHVTYEPGLEQYNMYDAYYVLGRLSSQVVRHELANSAYSLKAEHVELYDY
jgi:hypothetical protein